MRRAPYPEEVAFDAPARVADGRRGTDNGFAAPEAAYLTRARFRYLRGGETVQAARLTGTQPVVVIFRFDAGAPDITTDWRMRDLKDGTVYNIRSGPVPTDDLAEVEFTCESGVAL